MNEWLEYNNNTCNSHCTSTIKNKKTYNMNSKV